MRVVFRSNKDKRVQVVKVKVVQIALVVVCGLDLISKVHEGRLSFQQGKKVQVVKVIVLQVAFVVS